MNQMNINQEKSSLALDLESLNAKYKNLLTKYKQAVLDYIDNLNTESNRPCAKYSANSTGIDQACYEDIWKKAGCTTTGKVNDNTKRTLNGLILDSFNWATKTDSKNREGCYGTTTTTIGTTSGTTTTGTTNTGTTSGTIGTTTGTTTGTTSGTIGTTNTGTTTGTTTGTGTTSGTTGTTTGKCDKYIILGVKPDGKLYSKQNFDANWVKVNDDSNDLINIFTSSNGKVYAFKKSDIVENSIRKYWEKSKWDASNWVPSTMNITEISKPNEDLFYGKSLFNLFFIKNNTNPYKDWFTSPTTTNGIMYQFPPNNNDETISIYYFNNTANCRALKLSSFGKSDFMKDYSKYVNVPLSTFTFRPDGSMIGVGADNKFYTHPNWKELETKQWSGPYGNTDQATSIATFETDCKEGFISSFFSSFVEGFSTAKSPNYNINAPILTDIKGQAFWGTSGIKESVSNSLQECSALCSTTSGCSGATFNPDKKYCWIRGGEGSTMPGKTNDYAIVPKSTQLLKIVESLNNEIKSVNRQMQKKIDEVYGDYGKQVENRFDKNYSLINQYEYLNGEREKINNMLKEYQTLEETQNEMGIYITKNYYLFFVFFVVVFVAGITLAMSTLDQNTSSAVTFAITNPVVETSKVIANNVDPFYLMFGIILLFVIVYLYNQYITAIYNNTPSFKKMGQLGIVYLVFVIVIIFIVIQYFTKNSGTSYMPSFSK